jgi:hypothetical protein
MKLLFIIFLATGMMGCRRGDSYKIVSFSEDPSVSSGSDPILGHKFILLHNGVRIVAHCWVTEHANSGTSCLTLKSKVGETVRLETLKVLQDVLVYRPNAPNNEPQEMLRIASASAE